MLTQRNIRTAIHNFIAHYNSGAIETACNFYAKQTIYYDGKTTETRTREWIAADMREAQCNIVGREEIILTKLRIAISIDSQKAVVIVDYMIDENEFIATLMVYWLEGQPQVTQDSTICTKVG